MKRNFFQLQKMSLKIIKAGFLDTIQDEGRFGFQSSGINPGGVMDRFSAQLANCLLGKPINSPVIEIHFPSSTFLFGEASIICITGADFYPVIDGAAIQLNQPVIVNKNAVLEFKKLKTGTCCYLSVFQEFSLKKWLNSYSTNLKAQAGGYDGRALRREDVLHYLKNEAINNYLQGKNFLRLPYKAEPFAETETERIELIPGNEWNWLTEKSQQVFQSKSFKVSAVADRMGYRLRGSTLKVKEQKQLVSSAVSFGTLQLLPNGQLIVLMADHQTTGGYPRIGHVISAHLPALAQMKPNDALTFKVVNMETAEQKLLKQHQYLLSVQYASAFKIEKILQ